ncbi:hypothetical protein FSARC_10201 [Fusarium sarcochroum]|uniref:DUF7708 domain-containing protein n=1 Tax=Fusarium sarcochroum TaxID=1208366 RepID=A0A8H4X4R6_9HYPO|nr:hypothetical protein FSARC_10201 [Fusarium sarcochroum]
MDSNTGNLASFYSHPEGRLVQGKILIRRFTDELMGANDLEQSTIAAQAEIEEEEEKENNSRLRHLFDDSPDGNTSPRDFEIAEIARVELETVVKEFIEDHKSKPSKLQRVGIHIKPSKDKAIEVLQSSVETNFSELKDSIDQLETNWKAKHGRIYNSLEKLCETFEGHKSVFAIFPSQGEYTSVFCGGLSCLVKAARNHKDVAETLSDSIANISSKVTRCSDLILIIRTQRLRKLLADIYARMFRFYRDTITWYLKSRAARLFDSFNENLKQGFDSATADIEACISELYREASIGSHAMLRMLCQAYLFRQRRGYQKHDTTAGRRMIIFLQSNLESDIPHGNVSQLTQTSRVIEPASDAQDRSGKTVTRHEARNYASKIDDHIIGGDGHQAFDPSQFWVAEDDVVDRLQSWMDSNGLSRVLWISSPYDTDESAGAPAVAMSVISTAWQAEAPIISHFCQRPRRGDVGPGMNISQAGLIGLVYSLISQLLQFSGDDDRLNVEERELASLNGETQSWDAALKVLRELLDNTPVMMYCVIDGLNDLEWTGGATWCEEVLDVLFSRQLRPGIIFNILLTTKGQSRVLSSRIGVEDRHLATKLSKGSLSHGETKEQHRDTVKENPARLTVFCQDAGLCQ